MTSKTGSSYEKLIELTFRVCASLTVISVILITVYIFIEGVPPILQVGISNFIFGTEWKPTAATPQFGILPMILATLFGAAGAILLGVPVGIFNSCDAG
jgi:phosphate transport system permease protein